MRQANILDPIRPELSPLVFDNPAEDRPQLKPHHRQWLIKSINKALKDGGYEGMEKWLSLVFTGSLTTYQYSDESDVDISLFVDTKNFPDWSRAEMIGLMVDKMDGITMPGVPHPLQCFVVAPGISRSDLYKKGMRSGYDLDTNEWIVPPERERVLDVEAQMSAQYVHALQQADKMEKLLTFEADKAIMLWHQIHRRRRRDMQKGKGDYSDSNITYKMLANRGIFPKLSEVSGEYIARVASSDYAVLMGNLSPEEGDAFSQYLAEYNEADRDSGELDDVPCEQVERWYENWESEGKPGLGKMASELHIGLELPKDVTEQIHNWVEEQDWPEGAELEDPSDYHITLVYAPDGHEDHAEDEWRHAEKGYDAEVTGLDLFGDEEQKAVVLKVKSPDVVRHAEDVIDVAEDRGLEISKFPGGYKPHITVAYATGKPKGSPLKLKFKTGPSSVSEPRTAVVQPLPEFDIASVAYQAAVNSGGITIRIDGVVPTVGYAFSPFKGQEEIIPVAALTEDDIAAYVDEHKQQLADPQNHLGIWVDGLNAYIDVTQTLIDFDAAYKLAWDADQEAMWDIVQQKEIPVRKGGSSPLEIASHFGQDASRLAVNLKQPQVAKWVYNIPEHHLIVGDMGREEGEFESHYDLMQKAGLEPKNNVYGQFSPNGRAITFGRPKIEGFGKAEMNPKEAEYRAKQALEMAVPGTRLEAFEPSHDKWNVSGPPKTTYMREPPVLGDGPIEPPEDPADEWKFGALESWSVDPRAIDKAAIHLGLRHPVKVRVEGGSYGQYQGLQNGTHIIKAVNWLKPASANGQIWHELVHAKQAEDGMEFPDRPEAYDDYRAQPHEQEAHDFEAPFQVVLPMGENNGSDNRMAVPK